MVCRADGQFDFYYNLEDWKTNYYVADIDPNKQYFYGKGFAKKHNQFRITKFFGVSISTKDIVYYIDGVEVKRASTMENYNSGQLVDALKAAGNGSTLQDIAQKAYGFYGQEDWNYNAGYTGDFMTLQLGTAFNAAEVDAAIDGQYALVDYFRIFKKTADLNNTAAENITFDGSTSVTLNSNAVNSGNSIVLKMVAQRVFRWLNKLI